MWPGVAPVCARVCPWVGPTSEELGGVSAGLCVLSGANCVSVHPCIRLASGLSSCVSVIHGAPRAKPGII